MDIRYKHSLQPMEGPHHTERLRPQSPNTSLREPILEEHDRTLTPAKRPQRYSWNQGHEHVYSHSHNESKPKLPTFDGKKDTWEPFLMQFRLMSNSYNWSDRKFREQLIFALREKALLTPLIFHKEQLRILKVFCRLWDNVSGSVFYLRHKGQIYTT